jgi:hypothetical protein
VKAEKIDEDEIILFFIGNEKGIGILLPRKFSLGKQDARQLETFLEYRGGLASAA